MANEWEKPDAPPPPLFLNDKERDFVKQINDEIIERIVGQRVAYYAIDLIRTNFHPLYGEAIDKVFMPPVLVHAIIDFKEDASQVNITHEGIDKRPTLTIHFHKRRLTEDQDVYVKEGDFVSYGTDFYEILKVVEPREIWGSTRHKIEISATCIKARRGAFNVAGHTND